MKCSLSAVERIHELGKDFFLQCNSPFGDDLQIYFGGVIRKQTT